MRNYQITILALVALVLMSMTIHHSIALISYNKPFVTVFTTTHDISDNEAEEYMRMYQPTMHVLPDTKYSYRFAVRRETWSEGFAIKEKRDTTVVELMSTKEE